MRVGLVYNPTAGGGRTRALAERFATLVRGRGVAVEQRTSRRPGDATDLARELSTAVDVVVAAGGDGTVNEVINGLVGSGVPLGILPAGTVNVLAKELDLPSDPAAACDVVLAGATVALDTGIVRAHRWNGLWGATETGGAPTNGVARGADPGRRFVLMVGAGLDALTVRELDPRRKRRYRRAAFVLTGVTSFVRHAQPVFDVIVEGDTFPASFVVVGNCRYYGGRFGLTDRADPTDGLLDVMIFGGRGFGTSVMFWLGTPVGLHLRHPAVTYVRGRHVELRPREPGDVVWFQTDGELAGRLPASVEIEAHTLRVLIPPAVRRATRRDG